MPFKPPGKTIAGTDKRKEYRAAAVREKPNNAAAVIVMPEREVPGIKARA